MISFRDKSATTTSVIIVASILALLGTLIVMVFVPPPTAKGLSTKARRDEMKARIAIKDAREREAEAMRLVAETTWAGNAQTVGPAALARVTQMAKSRNLRLVAFRPQRQSDDADLTMLPFLITVEGTYPNVVQFSRDLETTGTRLSVSMVQVSSADANSDRVTATVATMAYLNPRAGTATTPAAGGRTPSKEAPRA